MLKVNIGGGRYSDKFPSDWCVVDSRPVELLPPNSHFKYFCNNIMHDQLPFDDNSVDAVYTSHTLEHVYADRLPFVLSEIHRVLKNDALLRVSVPDVDIAIDLYVNKKYAELAALSKIVAYKINELPDIPLCHLNGWFFTYKGRVDSGVVRAMPGGHVTAFNYDVTHYFLNQSGFKNINKMEFGKHSPVFQDCDFARYKNGSLYVEAAK